MTVYLYFKRHFQGNFNARKYGAAKELMIPAHLKDFLPSIRINLIKDNVDINEEYAYLNFIFYFFVNFKQKNLNILLLVGC